MNIQFDETNLLADMVGRAHGVTRAEVERAQPKAQKALAGFRKLSDAGRYGFPQLPFQSKVVKAIVRFAAEARGSFDTVCVVGIGGSALGAWALDCGLRGPHPVQGAFSTGHPRLVILDNVDPDFTAAALASMDPHRTLVVVIAKSGGTAETVATFLIVREWLQEALGATAGRIVAVTTEGKGDLYALAQAEGYAVFGIPENVGGRFSVLTPVGLVPAALIGIDIAKLCRGAAKMTDDCWQPDLERNIALRAALYHWLVWTRKDKPIQVAFPYSNHLWGTAFWFRQLWAESLGKATNRKGERVNTGQTPIAALGATDWVDGYIARHFDQVSELGKVLDPVADRLLFFVGIGALVVAFLGWFAALFTGRLPESFAKFLLGYVRWTTRVYAYEFLMTDAYPPFALDPDPSYPVDVTVTTGRLNRFAVLFRIILVIQFVFKQ